MDAVAALRDGSHARGFDAVVATSCSTRPARKSAYRMSCAGEVCSARCVVLAAGRSRGSRMIDTCGTHATTAQTCELEREGRPTYEGLL